MHSSSHNNSQKQFFFTLINDEMSFCTFFTIPRNIYTARRWIVFLQFRYRCNITEMRIDTFANSENIYPMNNKFKGKCTNGISGDLHQPLQWQCIHTCNERLKFGLLSGVLIEIDSLFSSLGELLWKLSVQKCPSVQVLIRISIMHEFVNIVNTILRSRWKNSSTARLNTLRKYTTMLTAELVAISRWLRLDMMCSSRLGLGVSCSYFWYTELTVITRFIHEASLTSYASYMLRIAWSATKVSDRLLC